MSAKTEEKLREAGALLLVGEGGRHPKTGRRRCSLVMRVRAVHSPTREEPCHGMHSRYLHAHLAPLLAQAATDPEPLNLLEELAVARALLSHDLATHATLGDDDVMAFARRIETVDKMVARIEKIRSSNAISQPDLVRLLRYRMAVVEAVGDDPEQVAMITHRWGQCRYGSGAGRTGA